MKSSSQTNSSLFNLSTREIIFEKLPDLKGSLDIFNACVPGPIDRRCELAVLVGAVSAINHAVALLIEPSLRILEIQNNLAWIAEACEEHYTEISAADDRDTQLRGLKAYPAWLSLATSGFLEDFQCQGAKAAQGINLALAWIGAKDMAEGFMRQIEKSMPGCNQSSAELLYEAGQLKAERGETPEWFSHFEVLLTVFWKEFDLKSHQTLPKKTFQEKAESEWAGRAAYPGPKRRAGVLTDRCLSTRQVKTALSHTGSGMFSSPIHRAIAIWFIGFSGFYTQTVQRIPLVGGGVSTLPDDWRAYYDVRLGILFRDYSSLAKSAASAEGLQAQPASYVFATPAPQRIADYVRELYANTSTCVDLGDLVQELKVIQPEWHLYPSTESLSPSFAKWARTPGPLLRQLGIDALLAALISGDLGITARSKLYYCHIEAPEIWESANRSYKALGLGEAVCMP